MESHTKSVPTLMARRSALKFILNRARLFVKKKKEKKLVTSGEEIVNLVGLSPFDAN